MFDFAPPELFLVFFAMNVVLTIVCGYLAAKKGYSGFFFSIQALFTGLVSLVIVVVLRSKHQQIMPGVFAKLERAVTLDGGGKLPRGMTAQVQEMKVIDGHVVCRVQAPEGTLHWLDRNNLLPA
jgi:hypothetical protein